MVRWKRNLKEWETPILKVTGPVSVVFLWVNISVCWFIESLLVEIRRLKNWCRIRGQSLRIRRSKRIQSYFAMLRLFPSPPDIDYTAFIASVLSKTSVLINEHAFFRRLYSVYITHFMVLTSFHVIIPCQSRPEFPIDTHDEKGTRIVDLAVHLPNLPASAGGGTHW